MTETPRPRSNGTAVVASNGYGACSTREISKSDKALLKVSFCCSFSNVFSISYVYKDKQTYNTSSPVTMFGGDRHDSNHDDRRFRIQVRPSPSSDHHWEATRIE